MTRRDEHAAREAILEEAREAPRVESSVQIEKEEGPALGRLEPEARGDTPADLAILLARRCIKSCGPARRRWCPKARRRTSTRP